MNTALKIDFPELHSEELKCLFDAFTSNGHKVFLVGGSVRNALLGRPVSDLDITVDCPPDISTIVLEAAGFEVIPVGFDHGTVVAILNGQSFEVTTFRKDVETDGRHAKVIFTDDIVEDAKRRDLTINALYADIEGNVFDPLGNIGDIEGPVVRFIGVPSERITEDFLRILRFFRFSSTYTSSVDSEGLEACVRNKVGLKSLSIERIRDEIIKIIPTNNAPNIFHIMKHNGILDFISGLNFDVDRFERAVQRLGVEDVDFLVSLILFHEKNSFDSIEKFKLPNKIKNRISTLVHLSPIEVSTSTGMKKIRSLIFHYGKEEILDILKLKIADCDEAEVDLFKEVLTNASAVSLPNNPLTGKELIKRGFKPGVLFKDIKNIFDELWEEADFTTDPVELDELISSAVSKVQNS
jgi:poly(A) polymerase